MSKKNGMGSHHSAQMKTDEWLTPPEIINAFILFDLDPCSPINRPWPTAKKHYTIIDDGLSKLWFGKVWCNPPYGRFTQQWLCKLSVHGNGVALIYARTETKMFFDEVWNKAHSLLFLKGRYNFYFVNGEKSKINCGAPLVLVAYGKECSEELKNCTLEGKYIELIK